MAHLSFDVSRVLGVDYPREAYKPSKDSSLENVVFKGLHFGQRKLLLSEIEFLCAIEEARGDGKPILCVYAGAANGSHLPFLFDLFPNVCFVLIDPAPFCPPVQEIADSGDGAVVELVQDYCTDELCLRLARMYGEKYSVYLISDIRSGIPKRMTSNKEHTEMMLRDNAWQKSWCWSLRAQAAMLKFHPPYPAVTDTEARNYDPEDDTPASIEYLDGRQLFGVWAPKSSSEVRLIVEGPFGSDVVAKQRAYCCVEHEEQCYHYNTHERYSQDCAAERLILGRYIKAAPIKYGTAAELSTVISGKLGFPWFKPLNGDFSEDNARWMTLLSSARRPEARTFYEPLKDHMTREKVSELVQTHKDSETIPAGVKAGDTELTDRFWNVLVRADFQEAYSYPRIMWRFFRLINAKSKEFKKTVEKRPRPDETQ